MGSTNRLVEWLLLTVLLALGGVEVASAQDDTFYGTNAGASNTTGNDNSAFGTNSLYENTTGSNNTATGNAALFSNVSGNYNVGTGVSALEYNTTGNLNTAIGTFALNYNTIGVNNTATGAYALFSNNTGSNNTAVGYQSLYSTTTANQNSAFGYQTLYSDTTGTANNAIGDNTLAYNTSGNDNNAVGYAALYSNTTGSSNNAQGYYALARVTTGSSNVGLGQYAGYNQTIGSNNIYIGNEGVAAESAVIKIGTAATQTSAFIAGISGVNVTGGAAVMVNASGQLGVVSSSRRYKEDIHPLGDASERLYQLRPVTFRYRKADEDGRKPVQYGLIAEDVAEVMPELTVYDRNGEAETVAYQVLPTLLLNEAQKARKRAEQQTVELQNAEKLIQAQAEQLRLQGQQLAAMQSQLAEVTTLVADLRRSDAASDQGGAQVAMAKMASPLRGRVCNAKQQARQNCQGYGQDEEE